MSFTIRRTKGRAVLNQGRWFIHGPGKKGKSTFASGFPNNFFLASERRIEHLKNIEYAYTDNWEDFKDWVVELGKSKYQHRYDWITIDVVDLNYERCDEFICKKLKIDHKSQEGFARGYDMVDKEFKDILFKLLSYPYGLIFISHTKMQEITSLKGTSTKFISTLPPRARNIIIPHMGVIGYIDDDSFRIKDPRDGKTKLIDGRSISFEGNDLIEAGDGEGYLPNKLRLFKDPTKTYEQIKMYYDGVRSN